MQKLGRRVLANTKSALVVVPQMNKISWNHEDTPYNKRWQYKWRHAYYTYPRENDSNHVKNPKESKDVTPMLWAWTRDFTHRWMPHMGMVWDRRHRIYDNVQIYALPLSSLALYQFWDVSFGFKILTCLPLVLAYVRARDKTLDPDFKETYLRDMIYSNPEISELFNDQTIHVLDYDCEYDVEVDREKFPEYKNTMWNHFNTDTSMTTGHFRFGDVESGATMLLKFKTMPSNGRFRYQVGEPFFFYDLRAEISHNGIFKEVVLVDEEVCLKRNRPFLFLI